MTDGNIFAVARPNQTKRKGVARALSITIPYLGYTHKRFKNRLCGFEGNNGTFVFK
jgi:hypothetical protein